jgi:phage/plasmid-like protein (TIGR03299 family)
MAALFESGLFVQDGDFKAPWHGLGKIVPEDTRFNWYEAVVAAGMNWDVYKKPAGLMVGDRFHVPMTMVGTGDKKREVPRRAWTCRRMLVDRPVLDDKGEPMFRPVLDDKGEAVLEDGKPMVEPVLQSVEEEQYLGDVGGDYEIVQNEAMFQWFQPYLDSGEAFIHTAGSLNNGQWVWYLAKLNRESLQITDNDWVEKFLLLSSSHDGSKAVQIGFTPIRVVCANTLAAAHSCKESKLLKVRHTKKVHMGMEEIRSAVNLMDQTFEATAAQYKRLASLKVSPADMVKYITLVLTNGKGLDEEASKSKLTGVTNKTVDILKLFRGARNDGQTWWGAYNAITEYLTWHVGPEGDKEGQKTSALERRNNRLRSLWFDGPNADKSQLALDIAIEMAA